MNTIVLKETATTGRTILPALLLAAGLSIAPQDPAHATVLNPIEFWNTELLQGIRDEVMTPTQAAYDVAIIDDSMFNAVDAATGLTLQPLDYSGGAVANADPSAAAFYAGEQAALGIFTDATSQSTLTAAATAYAAANGLGLPPATSSIANGQTLGVSAANQLLARSATDGSKAPMSNDTGSTATGQ